jgi:hypothetical protein
VSARSAAPMTGSARLEGWAAGLMVRDGVAALLTMETFARIEGT